MDIILNDQSITETELIGYSWGRVGVPVICGSGDDRLAHDLETMPWIHFVTVKKATSASTAEPRPVEEVRKEMREAAREALLERDRAQVMELTTPIRAALRAVPPANLEPLEGVPGIDYRENTVTFEAKDLNEAYDGLIALMEVAGAGYLQVLQETVESLPNAQAVQWDFEERLMNRWMDYESGRWSPTPEETPTRDRYHGAR
jgi:D-aminopeptidase